MVNERIEMEFRVNETLVRVVMVVVKESDEAYRQLKQERDAAQHRCDELEVKICHLKEDRKKDQDELADYKYHCGPLHVVIRNRNRNKFGYDV